MHTIVLPLTRSMRLLAAATVAAPLILVGMSPIQFTWRLLALLAPLSAVATGHAAYRSRQALE